MASPAESVKLRGVRKRSANGRRAPGPRASFASTPALFEFLSDASRDAERLPERVAPIGDGNHKGEYAGGSWRWSAGQLSMYAKARAYNNDATGEEFGEAYSGLVGRSPNSLVKRRSSRHDNRVGDRTPPASSVDAAAERLLDRMILLGARPNDNMIRGWLWLDEAVFSVSGGGGPDVATKWIEDWSRSDPAVPLLKGGARRWMREFVEAADESGGGDPNDASYEASEGEESEEEEEEEAREPTEAEMLEEPETADLVEERVGDMLEEATREGTFDDLEPPPSSARPADGDGAIAEKERVVREKRIVDLIDKCDKLEAAVTGLKKLVPKEGVIATLANKVTQIGQRCNLHKAELDAIARDRIVDVLNDSRADGTAHKMVLEALAQLTQEALARHGARDRIAGRP